MESSRRQENAVQGILVVPYIRRYLFIDIQYFKSCDSGSHHNEHIDFSALRSVRLIEIADFLERLDPLIILLIYIGIFVKMTAFYLGAVLGLSSLINVSHKTTVIVGAFIFTISFVSELYLSYLDRVCSKFEIPFSYLPDLGPFDSSVDYFNQKVSLFQIRLIGNSIHYKNLY